MRALAVMVFAGGMALAPSSAPTDCTVTVQPTTNTSALQSAIVSAGSNGVVCLADGPDPIDFPGQQYVSAINGGNVLVKSIGFSTIENVVFVGTYNLQTDWLYLKPVGDKSGVRIINGAHDLTLKHLVLDASRAVKGINIYNDAGQPRPHHITVISGDIWGSAGDLIGAYAVDNLTVQGSRLHDPRIEDAPGDHVDGVQVVGPAQNITIAYNRIYDTNPVWGGPHQAIIVGGAGNTGNVLVVGNIVEDWAGTGVIVGDSTETEQGKFLSPITVSNNTITCANGSVLVIRNNALSAVPSVSNNVFTYRSDPACPVVHG